MDINNNIIQNVLDDQDKFNNLFYLIEQTKEPHKSILLNSLNKMCLQRQPPSNVKLSNTHPIYQGRSLEEVTNYFHSGMSIIYYQNVETYQLLVDLLNKV